MGPVRGRVGALLIAIVVVACGTLFGAGVGQAAPPPVQAPAGLCSTEEWRNPSNFQRCVDQLPAVSSARMQCLAAPTPSAPDSGLPGWFAEKPDAYDKGGIQGLYTQYGYAGYSYTTYDIGCVPTVMHPDYKFENTIANGEFLIASSILGAANALREKAWNPQSLWGWADPLVENATKAIYSKVFTVFGAVSLAVIGLYLLWRSRQSDMSGALTTAGWAIFVMVAITAIAHWPTFSANMADRTLIGTLGVVHNAVGLAGTESDTPCVISPAACTDHRDPALAASDTTTEGILYRNWLRGELGSADSATAVKYGPALYDAKAMTWGSVEDIRANPQHRQATVDAKQQHWMKIAEQIKTEDPEAYEYLQGTNGMDRIGAGFIAILSAVFFSMFDIMASILILLGFLIFRWAVIAAPILGTIGLIRPASSGLRRLMNAVVAAIFNIIVFGTGAAIYLYAVDLIMSTASLAGWLQVVLIWLTGVVGWLLLRPYRRITQLGGKDSTAALSSAGSWHRLFFRDVRAAAALKVVDAGGTREPGRPGEIRPESRSEHPVTVGGATRDDDVRPEQAPSEPAAPASAPARAHTTQQWTDPDVPDSPSYSIYRPGSGGRTTQPSRSTGQPASPRRPESARPESAGTPRR